MMSLLFVCGTVTAVSHYEENIMAARFKATKFYYLFKSNINIIILDFVSPLIYNLFKKMGVHE